jgi:pilus assembly protein TadC
MIVPVILLVVIFSVALYMLRGSVKQTDQAWQSYEDSLMSSTEAIVRPLSKLFYGTKSATNLAKRSKFNEHIARDIAITGLFAGSLEVYASVQIGSVFAGLALMSLAQIDVFAGLFSLCFLGIGLLLAIWPFQALRSAAKNKRDTILSELPDFADLLLMVMETWSVGQSLLFTSSRIEGVVALEMRELALALSTRTVSEKEAFKQCSDRLGTPEGREFVSALQSSVIDGTTAVKTIKAQVEMLREMRYQRQRGVAKRLPVGLVVTFTIHFLPLLFILALLPVYATLKGIG